MVLAPMVRAAGSGCTVAVIPAVPVVHAETRVLVAIALFVPGVALVGGLAGLPVPALEELVAVVGGCAAAIIVVIAFLVHAESKEAELPCGTGEELALRRALQPELRVQAFEAVVADSARTSTAVVPALFAVATGFTNPFRNANAHVGILLLTDLPLGAFPTVAHRSFSEAVPDLPAFGPMRSAQEGTVLFVAEADTLFRVIVGFETLPTILALAATAAAAVATARGPNRTIGTRGSAACAPEVYVLNARLPKGTVSATPSTAIVSALPFLAFFPA